LLISLFKIFKQFQYIYIYIYPSRLCKSHTKRYTYRLPAVLCIMFLS